MDYQALLIKHLERIDRVVQFIARRHRLSAADAEEFTSIVRLKLIDRDFAVLRKFEGRSNLVTYLTTVIDRLYLDFCIARWGKWRPSAAARRLGGLAIELERLLTRDGLTFDEAVGTLQTNHGTDATRDELHALFVQLPVRSVRKLAGEEELALVAARAGAADPAFDEPHAQETVERVEAALGFAVARLPAADRLLLKLHFQEDLPIAKVARLLSEEPKPLYRRLVKLVGGLRDELRSGGIDKSDIDRIVGHPALTLGKVFQAEDEPAPEDAGMGPSKR